jgi:hypothetical protein
MKTALEPFSSACSENGWRGFLAQRTRKDLGFRGLHLDCEQQGDNETRGLYSPYSLRGNRNRASTTLSDRWILVRIRRDLI